ncbi:proline-rich protein 2-like [Lutra lutra]|uniref:proline-rich protein 2-like n=1 Tax=Lutra lutra TaxID=9657 RepID=UPI001FD0D61F|nr:proline-rich protein 2-like [Lutra lutra]
MTTSMGEGTPVTPCLFGSACGTSRAVPPAKPGSTPSAWLRKGLPGAWAHTEPFGNPRFSRRGMFVRQRRERWRIPGLNPTPPPGPLPTLGSGSAPPDASLAPAVRETGEPEGSTPACPALASRSPQNWQWHGGPSQASGVAAPQPPFVITVCSAHSTHVTVEARERDDPLAVEGPGRAENREQFPGSLCSGYQTLPREQHLRSLSGAGVWGGGGGEEDRATPTPPYRVPQHCSWPNPPPRTPAGSSPSGPQDGPAPGLPLPLSAPPQSGV